MEQNGVSAATLFRRTVFGSMKNHVDELALSDVFTTAARAAIHERCAAAFLHDVRGSMQALFSAFELMGRAARLGATDAARVEKAWELARRAISNHEKSTLDVLQLLTLEPTAAAAVDLKALVDEVANFLRNEAASKYVTVAATADPEVRISVERAKLQTLLIGLLTAAIEETPSGAELRLSVGRQGGDAVIAFGSHGGLGDRRDIDELLGGLLTDPRPRDLTLLFARQFLAESGGRLEIDGSAFPSGSITLYHPAL
jgi:signal transduction histidine kinase